MTPLFRLALIVGGAVTALVLRALAKEKSAARPQAMSDLRAFISFDFDHNEKHKRMFAGQCSKHSPTPFTAQDWSSKEALPQTQWERTIREKIGRCHMMFVLVSPTSHKARGVAKEIEMAIAQKAPLVGVYIAGANDATPLPPGLDRARTVPWEWKRITIEIERVLGKATNRF